MIVNGHVRMNINMNVNDLETDAVGVDRYGELSINDPEQFFMDWVDAWNTGIGELLGASDENADIEKVEEDEEDEDDIEEDED